MDWSNTLETLADTIIAHKIAATFNFMLFLGTDSIPHRRHPVRIRYARIVDVNGWVVEWDTAFFIATIGQW